MTIIDPVKLVVEILTSLGHTEVHSDRITARSLSSPEYIFVQEQTGIMPHIRYSDRPTIQILVYSNLGFDESRRLSYKIVQELQDSQGKTFASGGIHRVIPLVRPSRLDVAGLPNNVGRTSTQLDLILSSLEKWDLGWAYLLRVP